MASGIYPRGRNAFMTGALIDWIADDISMVFAGSGYAWNGTDPFGDLYFSAVTNVIGPKMPLTGKTSVTAGIPGVAGADNIVSPNIDAGSTITQIIVFRDTGTPSSSTLLAHIDVIPTPTNGGPVTVTWNPSGIFIL